jgi:hypothetical protein
MQMSSGDSLGDGGLHELRARPGKIFLRHARALGLGKTAGLLRGFEFLFGLAADERGIRGDGVGACERVLVGLL